jgi:excisionase family DNA binding protein
MATWTASADGKTARLEGAVYTVRQLSELLQVSERHIHRLRANKEIPGEVRFGTKAVRFVRSIIDRWLSEGGGK